MKSKLLILLLLLVNQVFSQNDTTVTLPGESGLKPSLLWKFKTNGPVVGAPVIGNGTAYITSLDSVLYALDMVTGKVKWKRATGAPLRSSVCLAYDYLFLLGGEGILYTVKQDSGQAAGYFRTLTGIMGERQNDYADYYQSTPVIEDTIIYFGSGGALYAVSINSGLLNWKYETGDVIHTSPVVNAGKVYFGSFDGNLYSVDTRSGNLSWKFKTTGHNLFPKGEVSGNPVFARGMVYVGSRDYHFYALDASGGHCNWMKQFPLGWALPATLNDSVLIVGTSDDHSVIAYNLTNGKELWKTDAGFNVLAGCALDGKMGYVGTLCGKVHGINLATGQKIWTVELDSYKANHLSWLKPDDTYRDDLSQIMVTPLDMIRMYGELGGIFGTPAIADERLVVAGYDGWVYCYSTELK
jgi:outer membrane protein assembly factor BamB